jgi:uncharacterized surface protein with fasciclin (FAS1) repeats
MKTFLICVISLLAAASATAQAKASLSNTSSRGMVGAGNNVLITGFVVAAEPGELRWLLIRGVGPSLAPFGITNALPDPELFIYNQRGHVVATNRNHGDAVNQELMNQVRPIAGAFPLTSALDASALVGLPSGAYTAVVRGANGGTGVALVEAYDVGTVAADTPSQSISGLAASTPGLSTLATALRRTGLDAVLAAGGPFTVFAPTDAAFAALPAGTLDALLANPAALADVLRYHVVSGAADSSSLANGQTVPTLLAGAAPLSVTINDAGVQISGANVVAADVEAVNGVVHVIDAVLVP